MKDFEEFESWFASEKSDELGRILESEGRRLTGEGLKSGAVAAGLLAMAGSDFKLRCYHEWLSAQL